MSKKFENQDPFEPWNDPFLKDDPVAPWNDPKKADDPFEPWNSPMGAYCDIKDRHDRRYLSRAGYRCRRWDDNDPR